MDANSLADFEGEVLDAWRVYESDEGLTLQLRMVVASATKPAA
jgi:hypothetical protein